MKTILVIDDDADLRSSLCALLRRHQWQVWEAADGREGVALARAHQPQAILCDLLMPGMNGFRVCTAVRSDPALRRCLVVAMSGRGFEDNRRAAIEAGADEFLAKPLQTEQLLELLAAMTARGPAAPDFPETNGGGMAAPIGENLVRFWGVRGSIPVPGPATVRYGGNTACVEVRAAGRIVILDAGTGLRPLGESLVEEFGARPMDLSLLITHAHWDHVQGFPFFKPAYQPSCRLRVLGFDTTGEGLPSVFARQMETPYFPISLHHLAARVEFEERESMEFKLGPIQVQSAFVNHPGVCVGFRLTADGVSVAFVPDHEPFFRTCLHAAAAKGPAAATTAEFAAREDDRIVDFLRGVDVLILDAQFNSKDYPARVGWGHSSVDDAVALALRAGARRLFLFHHNPLHTDADMDALELHARKLVAQSGSTLEVTAAREGMSVPLTSDVPAPAALRSRSAKAPLPAKGAGKSAKRRSA